MRLYALGIDDSPETNFKAAAIRQLLDPTSVAGGLQDIVEKVIQSADGLPTFADDQKELVQQVMLDYNGAYHAALQGTQAFNEYRKQVMMPFIVSASETMIDHDTEHENAIEFLGEIDDYEERWKTFVPSRPLERIIQDIFDKGI